MKADMVALRSVRRAAFCCHRQPRYAPLCSPRHYPWPTGGCGLHGHFGVFVQLDEPVREGGRSDAAADANRAGAERHCGGDQLWADEAGEHLSLGPQ